MASYGQVLEVLGDYRNALSEETFAQAEQMTTETQFASAFAARGGMSAFATPMSNVHATGVGVRVRRGKIVADEFVIKLYVYEKVELDEVPDLSREFGGVEVDVEPLAIQQALQAVPTQRKKHRPIPGGVSVAPLNQPFVGTLGCFLRGGGIGPAQVFALSNNHVFADVNRLAIGTTIVQPGPEVGPTTPTDAFAALSAFVPIQFPTSRGTPVVNRIDAAVAIVADQTLIKKSAMLGITNYTPRLLAPAPGMRVTKSGRTTGVTTGMITATRVNGVVVNYGTRTAPRLATFNDAIEIVGDGGRSFSMPGDSGSVILDRASGRPVALLFAGDGRTTTACDLGTVCRQFSALPI